ncbi:MAG: hypothetical protein K2G29_07215 [Muribaculaceae bacterium]|nr:hypothetical protein [Muribaculaceae bacterium]
MPSHPLTASERRGILIIAALALLITGAGLCVSHCGRSTSTIDPHDVEVLYRPDGKAQPDSVANLRKGSRKSTRKDSGRGSSKSTRMHQETSKKSQKVYHRRSPRDEEV